MRLCWPAPHADGLSVLYIADGIGLGVFQCNQGHNHVDFGLIRKGFILCHQVGQQRRINFEVIASLLEGDAKDILVFLHRRNVGRVNFHNIVSALFSWTLRFPRLPGYSRGR